MARTVLALCKERYSKSEVNTIKNQPFKTTLVCLASVLILVLVPFLVFHEQSNNRQVQEQKQVSDEPPRPILKEKPLPAWSPGSKGPLAASPDFSSVKSLALSIAYPLYKGGGSTHPAAYTGGGPVDRSLASSSYKQAKSRARNIAKQFENAVVPSATANYADCGAFTATIVINKIDAHFPGLLVSRQRSYVKDPRNGWVKVAEGNSYNEALLRPGDLFISTEDPTKSGHTWIWLGKVNGQNDVIAQASFGPTGSKGAHLPALKINPLQGKPQDSRGRSYEVWRYQG